MEKRNVNTFVFWGMICLLANILCTYAEGYDGDQSFWVGWTQQLVDGGFGNFKGNYPPVYVFWLWVVEVEGRITISKIRRVWVDDVFAHKRFLDWDYLSFNLTGGFYHELRIGVNVDSFTGVGW